MWIGSLVAGVASRLLGVRTCSPPPPDRVAGGTQILPEYLDLRVEETDDLVRLANWWRENKNTKSTKAQQRGLPDEDPEKAGTTK